MNTPDPFAEWDAAYVLGALSVADRRVFEEHLADCDQCRAGVSELAGMPGLLAGLPKTDAVALADSGRPTPDDAELPPALATMRTRPRRIARLRVLLVLAIVAALLIGVAIGAVGGYLVRDRPQPAPSRTWVAFSPLHPTPMTAVADLTRSGRKTKINIDCQYAAGGTYTRKVDYVLYVVDEYGQRRLGTRWSAGPGDRKAPRAETGLTVSDIASLEIDYADSGKPVMRGIP